jgi:hypothetical protein
MKTTGDTKVMMSQAGIILQVDACHPELRMLINANKICAINCILKAPWEAENVLLRNPMKNTLIEEEGRKAFNDGMKIICLSLINLDFGIWDFLWAYCFL